MSEEEAKPHGGKRKDDDDAPTANAESRDDTVRFEGKIAFWWYAIIVLMLAWTVGMITQGIIAIANSDSKAIVIFLGVGIFIIFDIFLIDSCVRNYVDLSRDSLRVRVSVFTEIIPCSTICLVKETNSAWASFSTSLDRIQVRYRSYNDVLIAVKNKESFFSEIRKRNPQIAIERKGKNA